MGILKTGHGRFFRSSVKCSLPSTLAIFNADHWTKINMTMSVVADGINAARSTPHRRNCADDANQRGVAAEMIMPGAISVAMSGLAVSVKLPAEYATRNHQVCVLHATTMTALL